MAHTETDEVGLIEAEVDETSVGMTSSKNFEIAQPKINVLKQNLKCGFCGTLFSRVPKKGYLYPHTKMEDETDGRNACENCHPVELALAIEAGLILPVIKVTLTKKQAKVRAEEQTEPPKKKRGRPRKVRLDG